MNCSRCGGLASPYDGSCSARGPTPTVSGTASGERPANTPTRYLPPPGHPSSGDQSPMYPSQPGYPPAENQMAGYLPPPGYPPSQAHRSTELAPSMSHALPAEIPEVAPRQTFRRGLGRSAAAVLLLGIPWFLISLLIVFQIAIRIGGTAGSAILAGWLLSGPAIFAKPVEVFIARSCSGSAGLPVPNASDWKILGLRYLKRPASGRTRIHCGFRTPMP